MPTTSERPSIEGRLGPMIAEILDESFSAHSLTSPRATRPEPLPAKRSVALFMMVLAVLMLGVSALVARVFVFPAPPASRDDSARGTGTGSLAEETGTATSGLSTAGTLDFDVQPWADVWVDGKSVGATPIAGQKLPPGLHDVEYETPDGTRKKIRVLIRTGETAVVRP